MSSDRLEASPQSSKLKRTIAIFAGSLCVLLFCFVVRWLGGAGEATANTANQAAGTGRQTAPAAAPRQPSPNDVVARVGGQPITRAQLGQECLKQFGRQVLETVMNRHLIALECQKHNIVVPEQEIDREIDRMARRFGLPVDQWLTLLQSERSISPEQYRFEIVWPTLALRRLAREQLEVSDDEIDKELESRFGPQVQVRLLAVEDQELANKLLAAVKAKPDDFSRFAVKYSVDIGSASSGGLVQPIRRHLGEDRIEKVAFDLREGEVSEIVPVGNQFIILKCEKHIPGKYPGEAQMQQARAMITESIRDKKLRKAGGQIFRDLQEQSRVQNVFNDAKLRKQMPGVAATINGHQITVSDLEKECIARHGEEVLEGTINHVLIELALRNAQVEVTQQDITAEVTRAARAADMISPDGQTDLEGWIDLVTEQQEITKDAYLDNVVWPTVALKKLVANQVKVTQEDIDKGFEANYGPRVRVRAIVMNNLRRAQEVWHMARQKPTLENFAELAAQYSIDPGSRALGGVVPPIQKHGGEKTLEEVAFKLQPGDLSGVVQVADKYVILLCEGRTEPVKVESGDVQDLLYEDILEKKFRIQMALFFEQLTENGRVTNYLYPKATRTAAKNPATARR